MNITPLHIYLWQLSDNLRAGLGLCAIICLLACFACAINLSVEFDMGDDDGIVKYKSLLKKFVCVLIAFSLPALMVPSSKTIALMYVIPGLANSTVIQRDVPELYDMAVKALKEQLSTEEKPQ